MAHLVEDMPELANERTFDCVAARGKEDSVLWSMLDAWRSADMPPSAALSKLQQTATDPRTTRRFMDGAEVERLELERVDAQRAASLQATVAAGDEGDAPPPPPQAP
jgi:hypothetical protein